MSGLFRFSKKERLSGKKMIRKLFRNGDSFFIHPFKVFYIQTVEQDSPAELLISVTRKNFRKAVTRNHIRRLIRESYRLNKPALYDVLEQHGLKYAIAIIYVDREVPSFDLVRDRINKVIFRLNKEIKNSN